MARPELPVGTWGNIRREQVGPNRFRARARYRDVDGITRDVEGWGTSGAAAVRALRVKLRDRSAPTNDEINRETRISRLAELWLDETREEARVTPQTIDRYTTSVRTAVLPALGNLRIREATVSRLDRFFKKLDEHQPGKARGAKLVLGLMLGMAVRHDALDSNPARDISRGRKRDRNVRALKVKQLDEVRAAIRQWQTPAPGKPGPRPTTDLADIVDLLLATGARISEVLALRWSDLDETATPPRLTFSGTIVYVKSRGFYRQPWTKSDAGYRTVFLPTFAVDVLHSRVNHSQPNLQDAIFASRRGTWLSPHNVRRQWRQARADTGLEWVTPHTFRKTVATLVDKQVGRKAAADQLGHNDENITKTFYIDNEARLAPDLSDVLQALGDWSQSA